MGAPRRGLGSARFSSSGESRLRPVGGWDAGSRRPGPGGPRSCPDLGSLGGSRAWPLPGLALARSPGARFSADPAGFRGGLGCGGERGQFTLAGLGREEVQGLDETFYIALDTGDHPFGNPPPGPGRDGLDERHQRRAEAVYRGQGGGVVHENMLVWMTVAGQGDFGGCGRARARWGSRKQGYPQMTQMRLGWSSMVWIGSPCPSATNVAPATGPVVSSVDNTTLPAFRRGATGAGITLQPSRAPVPARLPPETPPGSGATGGSRRPRTHI